METPDSFYEGETPKWVVFMVLFIQFLIFMVALSGMIEFWPSETLIKTTPSMVTEGKTPTEDSLKRSEGPTSGIDSESSSTDTLPLGKDTLSYSTKTLSFTKEDEPKSYLFWDSMSDETSLLILIFFSGAFGGSISSIRAITIFVGDKNMPRRWMGWHFIGPLVGAGLGLAFYLVIRGGFFSLQADIAQTNVFSFVGLAVLVGLFNESALEKLKQIANVIFKEPEVRDEKVIFKEPGVRDENTPESG